MKTRLLNMTWSNLRFNVWRSFVTMATNLPSCFSIQFLEQLLKFLVNFTLLKCVKSQRNYGFLITKELIFGFQILDLIDHFWASLKSIRWTLAEFRHNRIVRSPHENYFNICRQHKKWGLMKTRIYVSSRRNHANILLKLNNQIQCVKKT